MTIIVGPLAALNEARLNGSDVQPWQFVELGKAMKEALAAEPDSHSTIVTQLVKLTAWQAAFVRGAA